MTEPGSQEQLRKWLDWLYPNPRKPCRCEHAYSSAGRMHGIDMGKAWFRTTTHPDCVHHGTKAQRTFKQTGRWPSHT